MMIRLERPRTEKAENGVQCTRRCLQCDKSKEIQKIHKNSQSLLKRKFFHETT